MTERTRIRHPRMGIKVKAPDGWAYAWVRLPNDCLVLDDLNWEARERLGPEWSVVTPSAHPEVEVPEGAVAIQTNGLTLVGRTL